MHGHVKVKAKLAMSWKRLDFEDVRYIGGEERKYPEDWHRGKK